MAGENHQHATRNTVTILPGQEEDEEETRIGNLNFVKPPKANYDMRRNSFSYRVVDQWNNLPFELKTAESVNCFKNNYDKL